MKKFIYLLAGIAMILVTMIACEKDSIGIEETQATQEDVLLEKGAEKAEKVTICHYDADLEEYYSITISANGLSGHDGHEMDYIPDLFEGEYIPLDDIDSDGIVDCADCNVDPDNLYPNISSEKTMWYRDADGDGFGNPDVYIKTCLVRDGYVADNTDCDDTNKLLYPFSPVGDFIAISSGYSVWDMSIIDFDGTNFEGTGGFPSNTTPYKINAVLTGTVTNTNEFNALLTWEKEDGSMAVHKMKGTVSECDGVDHLDWKWALIQDVEDNDGDGYYDKYDCDDTDPNIFPYSPYGQYKIYRDNSSAGNTNAILNIFVDEDGNITGQGINNLGVTKYYSGTILVNKDHTILMTIPQSSTLGGDITATHYIGGFVSKCGGIVEDLSDQRTDGGTPYDYSFTNFE